MLQLRPIAPADNSSVVKVVRTVMPEYNCVGEGFSINDPELEDMFASYQQPGSAFYVLTDTEQDDKVVGVAGYAQLTGSEQKTCELRKMYLLPSARGLGGGKLLMEKCLAAARADGYDHMYLETVSAMATAAKVYKKYGFHPIDSPLGATGHGGCDRFYFKSFR